MKAATIGQRLCAERARLGKSQEEMSLLSGIPIDTYRKYEGDTRVPGGEALAKLARSGVNIVDVLLGDETGGELVRRSGGGSPGEAPLPRSGYVYLPLYDVRASAGTGALVDQEHVTDLLAFREEWLRSELNASPKDVCLLFVQGRSMEPDLRPGDVIMIDRRDTTAQYEAIYVIRMNGAVMVKELQRLPGGTIEVNSRNPSYKPFTVNVSDLERGDDFAIIGRVVWACRRF